jgi:DNA-binding transcriptional ArsR family regulator
MKLHCLGEDEARAALAALPSAEALAASAERAAAFADPTRLRVACVLAEVGELCVGDTAAMLQLPIALVSHHVRSLHARGLAEKRRDGKLVRYRLTPAGADLLAAALAAGRVEAAT